MQVLGFGGFLNRVYRPMVGRNISSQMQQAAHPGGIAWNSTTTPEQKEKTEKQFKKWVYYS